MNIVKTIKNTALIATFSFVSLNAFAASNLPDDDPIIVADLTTEQVTCIVNAYYQAHFENMDPDSFTELAQACVD